MSIVFDNERFVPLRETREIVRRAIVRGVVVSAALTLWLLPLLLFGHFVVLVFTVGIGGLVTCGELLLSLPGQSSCLDLRSHRIVHDRGRFKMELQWQDIRKVSWSTRPPMIELPGDAQSFRIRLYDFAPEQRLPLIRHFREGFAGSIQADWPRFCHLVALPLRQTPPSKPPPVVSGPAALGPGEYLRKRWHVDRWMIPILLSAAGLIGGLQYLYQVFSFVPMQTLGTVWIGLLPLVGIWAGLRFDIPAEGRIEKVYRWDRNEYRAAFLVFGGTALIFAFDFADRHGYGIPAMIATATLCFGCPLIVLLLTGPKRRREVESHKQEMQLAADASARTWEQMDAEEKNEA
jgi:hypothetical protein